MDLSVLTREHPALSEDIPFGTKAYDLMAALPLIAWYVLAVIAQLHPLHMQLAALDLALPQIATIMAILSKLASLLFALLLINFLLIRPPPKAGARRIVPRFIALLGTYIGVGIALLPQHSAPAWLISFSTLFAFAGMAFAIYTLAFLGDSFSLMPEARRLVTSGPYSVIRHPLYLGEELPLIGLVILNFSGATLAFLLLQMACQVYRMRFEEEVLTATFPEYLIYKSRTFRLLPGIY
jgi:protein-S-isoprenylcysteine O-methyltransferase Ste14